MHAYRDSYCRQAMNRARAGLFAAVLLCVVIAGCGQRGELREWQPEDHGQPSATQVDRSRVPDRSATRETSPEERRARAAQTLWRVTCASCHGHIGRGDGPGRVAGMNMPDMTTAAGQEGVTDEAMVQVIGEGRGMMPAFAERLVPNAVAQLVRHIRTLGR